MGSGALAVASLAGQEAAVSIGQDVLLFGNPYLSLVFDVVVAGASGWAWQQEQLTREQNVQRIWEEVQRRRSGGATTGANRSQRRVKAKVQSKSKEKLGFSQTPAPPPPPPLPSPPPPPSPAPSPSGGLMEQAKGMFAEANAMGRASALKLNSELEERGVLPALEPPSELEAEAKAEASVAPEDVNGQTGGGTDVAKSKKRSKKGGKKKSKRR